MHSDRHRSHVHGAYEPLNTWDAIVELAGFARGDVIADRYAIQRELGRGGMATVYLADDARYHRPVAIKVMHPELSNTVGAERFLREIGIAARLQHPHILPLFDSGEHSNVLYYVMPFVEGESLRDRLSRTQSFSIEDATKITLDVASALGYAHERGVVHRDIKPENILLSKGVAVVTDFGIARALSDLGGESLTISGIALGTPTYMSPEQGEGGLAIDGRADIYALGSVLYEMLTGVPPYTAPNLLAILAQKLTRDPQPLRELRQQVPPHVERAVSMAMARTPEGRFRSCAEFAAALTLPVGTDAVSLDRGRTSTVAGGQVDRPNLGPMISRMCNRWRQVNSFDASFRESQQKALGRPQIHVIHGPEGEAHDSLVARLVATRLKHFATEIGGEERGVVKVLRIPWPDIDDAETRQRDLAISLFREVSSGYLGTELTASALVRQSSIAFTPIVAIHHDLRLSSWDRNSDKLLQWYVNDFWGALTPDAQTPLVIVFLKVIYESAKPRFRLVPWQRARTDKRQEIFTRVESLLRAPGTRCGVHIAAELTSVTENDVKEWFNQHRIHGSEQKRRESAAAMFRSLSTRPMIDVEVALEAIRSDFVRQHSNEKGDALW